MATKSMIDDFPEMIELELMEDEFFNPDLELPKFIHVKIEPNKGGIALTSDKENRAFDVKDDTYFEWLSAIIRNHLG